MSEYRSLLAESASLLSEKGENPEYDRALAEVATFMGGGTSDEVHLTLDLLKEIKALKVNYRTCRLAWLPKTLEDTRGYLVDKLLVVDGISREELVLLEAELCDHGAAALFDDNVLETSPDVIYKAMEAGDADEELFEIIEEVSGFAAEHDVRWIHLTTNNREAS